MISGQHSNSNKRAMSSWVDEKGKIAGIDVGLSVHAAQDLARKLTFLHLGKRQNEMKPFAGLQVLKALPDSANKDLLLAAEYSRHFPSQSKEHLEKYLKSFEQPKLNGELGFTPLKDKLLTATIAGQGGKPQEGSGKNHPIAVLVKGRLTPHTPADKKEDDNGSKKSPFETLCDTEFSELLTTKEKESVGLINSDNSSETVMPRKLDDRVKELKARFQNIKQFAALGDLRKQVEELENMVGLSNLKNLILDHVFFHLWASPESHELGLRTHFCLVGSPGNGKTTAAKTLCRILGHLEGHNVKHKTGNDIGTLDEDGFRAYLDGGYVVLLDDAHKVDLKNSKYGKKNVLQMGDILQRPSSWVVMTGDEEELSNTIFSLNDTLRSCFNIIKCEDFTLEEIEELLVVLAKGSGWKYEHAQVSLASAKEIAKELGEKGFANMYSIRRFFQQSIQRAVLRNQGPLAKSDQSIAMTDVGYNESTIDGNPDVKRIIHEINAMVGWSRIKSNIQDLVQLSKLNELRNEKDQPLLDIVKNRLFLGNPGTGKTTCAKMYAALLKELGLLSGGEVVAKTASDLVGSAVGESQNKAADVLKEARGNVLIIDEAHTLNDDTFGKQVLDTLVEKVSGAADEDFAVLLVGYEEPMLQMLRDCNPGLSRRFPQDQAFYFDDYSDVELLDILLIKAKAKHCKVSAEFAEKAIQTLSLQRNAENFGNAGAVETMISAAFASATKRDAGVDVITLEAGDIADSGTERADKDADPLALLNKLYQMDGIKLKLDQMRKAWEVALREGDELPDVGHFVFQGSPGTGKTTVARSLAQILHGLHQIPSNRILETSALELTGEFIGQTKKKVTEKLRQAKGGILFIDEAYNLGTGSYGKEACDTLVGAMTNEEYRDVVIVLAGYTDEMNRMLQTNSGLRSRFTNFVPFADWTAKDCGSFFADLANKNGFTTEEEVPQSVSLSCESLMKFPGWANGRDVVKLFDMAKKYRSERIFTESGAALAKELSKADVEAAIKELNTSRAVSPAKKLMVRIEDTSEKLASEDASEIAPETKTNQDEEDKDKDEEDDADDLDEMTEEELFEKLKAVSSCPNGYSWNREDGGWRCEGGQHFVTDEDFRRQYLS